MITPPLRSRSAGTGGGQNPAYRPTRQLIYFQPITNIASVLASTSFATVKCGNFRASLCELVSCSIVVVSGDRILLTGPSPNFSTWFLILSSNENLTAWLRWPCERIAFGTPKGTRESGLLREVHAAQQVLGTLLWWVPLGVLGADGLGAGFHSCRVIVPPHLA